MNAQAALRPVKAKAPPVPDEYLPIVFPERHAKPRRIQRLAQAGLDLLYPPHCIACPRSLTSGGNGVFCDACATDIQWIGHARCKRCGDRAGEGLGVIAECPSCRNHPPAFVLATSAVAQYEAGPLRQAVLSLKFGHALFVTPILARLLAERIRMTKLWENSPPPVALIPVPLFKKDRRTRGFNQTEELATLLSQELKIPVENGLLKKIRNTAPQATLERAQRLENLKGVFQADPKRAARYKDKSIILVDDVMTTGATMSECARTLNAAGIGAIYAAVVARG